MDFVSRNLSYDFEQVSIKETHKVSRIIMAHVERKEEGSFECPICYENIDMQSRVTNSCGHHMCSVCTLAYLKTQQENAYSPCCAFCRHDMILLDTPNEEILNKIAGYIGTLQSDVNSDNDSDIDSDNENISLQESNTMYFYGFSLRRHRRVYNFQPNAVEES